MNVKKALCMMGFVCVISSQLHAAALTISGQNGNTYDGGVYDSFTIYNSTAITIRNASFKKPCTIRGKTFGSTRDILIENCDFDGQMNVNTCNALSVRNCDNVTIRNNKIHDYADDGIVITSSQGIKCIGNEIYGLMARGTDGQGGTGPCYNGHSDGFELLDVNNIEISANLYHANKGTAGLYILPISIDGNNRFSQNTNLILNNNLWYCVDNGTAAIVQHVNGVKMFNNTFWTYNQYGIILSPTTYNVVARNNIISSINCSSTGANPNSSEFDFDYSIVARAGVDYLPLKAHDIQTWEPVFARIPAFHTPKVTNVTAADFVLQPGSLAMNSGTSGGDVPTMDYFGNTRAAPVDRGGTECVSGCATVQGTETFIKGINLGAASSCVTTIGGNSFRSHLSTTGCTITGTPKSSLNCSKMTGLTPATLDVGIQTLLGSQMYGTDFGVNQTVSNGVYNVYIWACETYADYNKRYLVKLEGKSKAEIGYLKKKYWKRYGPYQTTVSDGVLNIFFARLEATPGVQGIEIYKVSTSVSTTETVTASSDSYVRGGTYVTANYGAANIMAVKLSEAIYTRKAIMNFDLSAHSSCSNAKLRWYVYQMGTSGAVTLDVDKIETAWSETDITWNNFPATVSEHITTSKVVSDTGWQELDITSLVNSEMSGGDKKFSIAFTSLSNNGDCAIYFHSRENTNKPQIILVSGQTKRGTDMPQETIMPTVKAATPNFSVNAGMIVFFSDVGCNLSIVNLNGRTLLSKRIRADETFMVPQTKLAHGAYLLRMVDDKNRLISKKITITGR